MITTDWQPEARLLRQVDRAAEDCRARVSRELGALVREHYRQIEEQPGNEYRKMLETSAKMTLAGRACAETTGYPFDARRQRLCALYGGCCFLADSFLDDFGESATREYLDRFERLLTTGWFDIRNERERLFYVIAARIFAERDLLDPMLRQAIFSLFLAQKRDTALRLNAPTFRALGRTRQLALLRQCARERGGHTITVLTRLVAPELPLRWQHLLYHAGALFQYIDDHGDCYADRRSRRITYMEQVAAPRQVLSRLFSDTLRRLREGLPDSAGRDLLCVFLFKYFVTRIQKHETERNQGGLSWAVYE